MIVTDCLFSKGKEASVIHIKSGSTQTAKVLLTLDMRTPEKLFGFDPVLQKLIQQEKHELKLLKRYIDDIVWNTFRGILKSTLSI